MPTEAMTNALPLPYLSGHLTIKGCDRLTQLYTLPMPNQEVRIGFTESRQMVKEGVAFEQEPMTVREWIVE